MIDNIYLKDKKNAKGMIEPKMWEDIKNNTSNNRHFKTFIEQRTDRRPKAKKRTTRLPGFNRPPWFENLGDEEEDQNVIGEDKMAHAMKADVMERKLELKMEDASVTHVQRAIVNLMKISIRREEGKVLASKKKVVVDDPYDTIFKKYLMIDGKGR